MTSHVLQKRCFQMTKAHIIHKRKDGFMRECQAIYPSLHDDCWKPGWCLASGINYRYLQEMLHVLFVQWPNCWWNDVHSTLVQCCGTTPESFHSENSTDEKYSQVGAACTERGLQLRPSIHLQSLPSEFAARMAPWLSFYGYPGSNCWSSHLWCLQTFVEQSRPSSCSQKMSHLLSWGGPNCSMKCFKG